MIDEQTLYWDVTVNKKYIGRCLMDPGYGLETAKAFIKAAIQKKSISESDLDYPNATIYKVVYENTPSPQSIVRKVRKPRVKKVIKSKVKKKVSKK